MPIDLTTEEREACERMTGPKTIGRAEDIELIWVIARRVTGLGRLNRIVPRLILDNDRLRRELKELKDAK